MVSELELWLDTVKVRVWVNVRVSDCLQ